MMSFWQIVVLLLISHALFFLAGYRFAVELRHKREELARGGMLDLSRRPDDL